MKVLDKGFVGRRRQIQVGIRCLKKNKKKIGVLLHGTGGLGKSCLAGRLCDRFKDHILIIVHGRLDSMTFGEALKDAFRRANDEKGLDILKESVEMPDRIGKFCVSSFRGKKYLILLDDFEKNLEGAEQGRPVVVPEAVPLLEALLKYLPDCSKRTQLIITSRYTFPITFDGKDLVEERLESIGLTSFRGADERKKIFELDKIFTYSDLSIREKLIEAGRGNPRLMEALNILLEVEEGLDVESLFSKIKDKQVEFVQGLILREILNNQQEAFQKTLKRSAVYRIQVLRKGIELVCKELKDWESFLKLGIRLSLVEEGKRGDIPLYWVTPLLREEIFAELPEEERKQCHQAAVEYYQELLSRIEGYEPVFASELIEHALNCGMHWIAIEEGSRLLYYLRESLAYREALVEGAHILSEISLPQRDEKFSILLFQFGRILRDMGNSKKAVEYHEQALSISKEIYGERHPSVAIRLSNLGSAWKSLGDSKKAIEYFEQAYDIFKEFYGDEHPHTETAKEWLDSLRDKNR